MLGVAAPSAPASFAKLLILSRCPTCFKHPYAPLCALLHVDAAASDILLFVELATLYRGMRQGAGRLSAQEVACECTRSRLRAVGQLAQ